MGVGGVAYEDCFGDIFNVSSNCYYVTRYIITV